MALTATGACSQKTITADPVTSECTPLETRQPNAPDQKPTFAGQTRACGMTSTSAYQVEVLAKGLDKPWAVEPLPDGNLLVTEKPGRMRVISATGAMGEPLTGLPEVVAGGQAGLLDVALSPTFATDRTIYWSFSEPRSGGNGTAVARGVLSQDNKSLTQVKVILSTKPTYNNTMHFGSRLAFGPEGMLYVTMGERSSLETRPQAQHMNSHLGKILRITPDGAPAPGNPFIGQSGALPEIWTVGHRNVQSSAFDMQGKLWIVEMGPQGGDELNLIEKGKNYGWPLVTFGEEYSGQPVPNAVTAKEGYESPVYYWDPVIAPSGAQFYTGSAFPEWQGNLFVGNMKDKRLIRLKIENGKVTGEEHLLADRGQRVRDVKQGPDGALYIVTDQSNGELWKVSPKR
ncbi:glucose dehydrogenase [Rufibacter sp. DG15C]|uniref:PQQ-dependent sugar dehydrogenase n=1 Tax=Rufibacter sp. DG15C TaxID=1379909 RepID=UPI00078E4D75|nr:PQQ-dependent sugar dehydrogenase [Rufibacter sp. DG15C]AMM49919.1 glucose dehydrogenase [Rufibacter sp. DG15C]